MNSYDGDDDDDDDSKGWSPPDEQSFVTIHSGPIDQTSTRLAKYRFLFHFIQLFWHELCFALTQRNPRGTDSFMVCSNVLFSCDIAISLCVGMYRMELASLVVFRYVFTVEALT